MAKEKTPEERLEDQVREALQSAQAGEEEFDEAAERMEGYATGKRDI